MTLSETSHYDLRNFPSSDKQEDTVEYGYIVSNCDSTYGFANDSLLFSGGTEFSLVA